MFNLEVNTMLLMVVVHSGLQSKMSINPLYFCSYKCLGVYTGLFDDTLKASILLNNSEKDYELANKS